MLVTSAFDDPNDNVRRFAGSVGNQLAQMVMIGILQLVFNDDFSICPRF